MKVEKDEILKQKLLKMQKKGKRRNKSKQNYKQNTTDGEKGKSAMDDLQK